MVGNPIILSHLKSQKMRTFKVSSQSGSFKLPVLKSVKTLKVRFCVRGSIHEFYRDGSFLCLRVNRW